MTPFGPSSSLLDELRGRGVVAGDLVGLVLAPGAGAAGWAGGGDVGVVVGDGAQLVAEVERALRPRWVVWSQATWRELVPRGTRVAVCWDVAAVHRMVHGEWRADPARVWARSHDLEPRPAHERRPLDLFDAPADDDAPVDVDGHLNRGWVTGGWAEPPGRLAVWAGLVLEVAAVQHDAVGVLAALAGPDGRQMAPAVARVESVAELLCAELAVDGLPFDRVEAERLIGGFVGPRPRDAAEAADRRAERDARVLRHAPAGTTFVLRNPGQVKSLLRATGIEVTDTRAWRLRELRGRHPIIDDLLTWRQAERIDTTFGYSWIDEHVGDDGRLRGEWSASDGAAGRMTATAGLHNMPAELRSAVAADEGHVLVRADLGQIEPRVLAAVSGDASLAEAALDDDLYLPVAAALQVDRPTAKVAVLGAMYGQTTGHGAAALRRLDGAFPVAMAFLRDAAAAGGAGRDLRTWGGRLVRLGLVDELDQPDSTARARAAARGRYARNAAIQGAAAELFKLWAVTVRARTAEHGARIVLCLHDELLVHAPRAHGDAVAGVVTACLAEAAHRWSGATPVRFVAEVSVVERWSDVP